VKPEFWPLWHANKKSLQNNGYSVRKSENGEWEVRFIPPKKSGWPPFKPAPVFIPTGMKASMCFKCGHVKLIKAEEAHRDCALCGEKIKVD
jgi:hypothetical protein